MCLETYCFVIKMAAIEAALCCIGGGNIKHRGNIQATHHAKGRKLRCTQFFSTIIFANYTY